MTFYIGVLGALLLVIGSAWTDRQVSKSAHTSLKNWLLFTGAITLFTYALLSYQQGGLLFFTLLQGLATFAAVIMMLPIPQRFGVGAITLLALCLVVRALTLFEDYTTSFFVGGLIAISFGYVLVWRPQLRNLCFFIGGVLIAIFGYLAGDWIFFWLNVFFAAFSQVYSSLRSREMSGLGAFNASFIASFIEFISLGCA